MYLETLDDSNFMLFAARNYQSPYADLIEFEEDLARIKYIKRLFNKYLETGEMRERLALNHFIVLYNVFEHIPCTLMLSFKLYEYLPLLKAFLMFLNYWPEVIGPVGIDREYIYSTEVKEDIGVLKILREI